MAYQSPKSPEAAIQTGEAHLAQIRAILAMGERFSIDTDEEKSLDSTATAINASTNPSEKPSLLFRFGHQLLKPLRWLASDGRLSQIIVPTLMFATIAFIVVYLWFVSLVLYNAYHPSYSVYKVTEVSVNLHWPEGRDGPTPSVEISFAPTERADVRPLWTGV